MVSNRVSQYALRGMVATSQPHATQVGIHVLNEGGNAVDAAIATAAALTVVEPVSNGIGGDAFALVRLGGEVFGLNGSGRSPASLTLQAMEVSGRTQVPRHGWLPVTVPGAPKAWVDLHRRWGSLPFERVLRPAIELARTGFVVTPSVSRNWELASRTYRDLVGPEFSPWHETFLPREQVPRPGQIFRCEDQARTLEAIAASNGDDFYEGALARVIHDFSAATGGHLTGDDLASHRSDWVEPLSVDYRDGRLWELPPNGQGVVALQALGVLNGFGLTSMSPEERTHYRIEALKVAFSDAHAYLGDPHLTKSPAIWMLEPRYLEERRELIGPRAGQPRAGKPQDGGTVYLAVVDRDGMMVSFIQSNFEFFGSAVVVPGTGIALQNRGASFNLSEGHPNSYAPHKRPYHTIMPGMLEHPVASGPLGVIGGHMQPQGHVQLTSHLLDVRFDPQAAIDAPRFQWREGLRVDLERHMPVECCHGLALRGHDVVIDIDIGGYSFGRAQMVLRRADGVLIGGSDGRADGLAAGW